MDPDSWSSLSLVKIRLWFCSVAHTAALSSALPPLSRPDSQSHQRLATTTPTSEEPEETRAMTGTFCVIPMATSMAFLLVSTCKWLKSVFQSMRRPPGGIIQQFICCKRLILLWTEQHRHVQDVLQTDEGRAGSRWMNTWCRMGRDLKDHCRNTGDVLRFPQSRHTRESPKGWGG